MGATLDAKFPRVYDITRGNIYEDDLSVGICLKLYCEATREKRLAESKQDDDNITRIQERKS